MLGGKSFKFIQSVTEYLGSVSDTKNFKQGVDLIIDFRTALEPYGAAPVINNFLKGIITKKESAKSVAAEKGNLQEQIDYVKAKIGDDRKGF